MATASMALATLAGGFLGCGGRAVELIHVIADAGPAASRDDTVEQDASPPDPPREAIGGSAAWVTSGARLRAIVLRTQDGAKQFTGTWFDTARSEECSFRPAADGQERCLPQAFPMHGPRVAYRHYTDASCDRPIVARRLMPGCATATPEIHYVVPSPSSGAVHAVVARRDPTAAWYMTGDGACVPETSPDVELFDVGAEVPPSAFVKADAVIEPGPGRLGYLTRVGEDGSRERLRAYDDALGASCTPRVTTDDFVRCGPWAPASVLDGVFVDAACATLAAGCPSSSSCGVPEPPERIAYAARARQDLARLRYTFFRIGPLPSSPAPAYRSTSGACASSGSLASNRGVVLEELAPSAMIPLAATFEATPTRLRRSVHEAPASLAPPGAVFGVTDVWQDTGLDATCRVEETADGATRCVPELAGTAVYFLDARCSDEPVVLYPDQRRRWARLFDTSEILRGCAVRPRLHSISSTTEYAVSYYRLDETKDGVACVRHDFSTPTILARVGADVTDTLERFDRVVE